MIDMTKIKHGIISDPEYIFFEKGKRGGVSYISNRYSKANNQYLKSCYQKQESKYIINLESNNLYGYECISFSQQVDSNG